MPSRIKKITGAAIDRRIAQGRGQGEGSEYTSWLGRTDVPSRGTSVLCTDPHYHRQCTLFSQGEWHYELLLLFPDPIVDRREQFPLPLDATLHIARRLKIDHPADPTTGEPTVVTTDFLLTVKIGNDLVSFARTFKRTIDLHGERLFEKLEIERVYWDECGVDWGIVTDADVPEVMWHNLDWIYDCWDINNLEPLTPEEVRQIGRALVKDVSKLRIVTISTFCSSWDLKLALGPGSCLRVARFLFANKIFRADMTVEIQTTQPMTIEVAHSKLLEA